MRQTLQVLFVEDSPDDVELVVLELRRCGYDVVHERVDTADAMRGALGRRSWDIILSDYSMPTFSAPAALMVLKASGTDIPFIIISGTIGEETAVAALKAGANDFLVKARLARLAPAIERELRDAEGRRRQRSAETALRSSEERFRAIMETATDAVISADSAGTVSYANPAVEAMFGYPVTALIGQPLARLIPDRWHDVLQSGLSQYAATGQAALFPRTIELIGRRQDGTEFPIDVSLGSWESNGKRFFAGIIRDIVDRKKVEAQLLIADRMVSVGTLAAGVAHEINNPLAAVIANLDLVIRKQGTPSGQRDSSSALINDGLQDAREAAERVRHIVRDLKIFSRGEDETRGPVDVHRVLESSLRMAWNEIRHRARITRTYGDVPLVEGSEARLGQVFLNILVNAAQAMPEGHANDNEIRIITRPNGHGVTVEIGDTGPGIPPEVMKRLFVPFVTTKPVGEGTGLGLSICHRIIAGFGGDIAVDSQIGKGTVVTIRLLFACSAEVAKRPRDPPTGRATRRGRILVVEDEPSLARIIERVLAEEHEVIGVDRAADALARETAGERFDVILCDLMMPEMTGMDLYSELSTLVPEQADAMVFVTGGAFTARARAFLDEVPNQCIEKPFDSLHLRAVVNDRVR